MTPRGNSDELTEHVYDDGSFKRHDGPSDIDIKYVACIITRDGPLWHYPEAILGLGLKPRPNVGFKLRNDSSSSFHVVFNP